MKNILLLIVTFVTLFAYPKVNQAQAPDLGRAGTFSMFTSVGAFSSSGSTIIRGDIGTGVGAYSGTPTLIGSKHVADSVSTKAATDLAVAYAYLYALTCDSTIGTTLGNNQTLPPNVYCLGAASTLNGKLTLDAKGNSNAIFVFKIDGAFSTSSLSSVKLINGASLCNVYWNVNGAVELGDSSIFMGNIVGNGAIELLEASALFGRGLTTAGAINLHNNLVSIGVALDVNIAASGSLTLCKGDSIKLTASTSNGMGVITYTWNNGGMTDSSIYVKPNTNSTYIATVYALNACHLAYDSAVISVISPANITTQPTSQSGCAGDAESFTVSATGTGLTYQWMKGSTTLTNSGNISGATSTTLTINPTTVSNAGNNYYVIVKSACGNDTSNNVSLTMNAAATITTQPTNQTGCAGDAENFTVTATGTGLTYQWMKGSTTLTNSGNISGATSATLTIDPTAVSDAGSYHVIVFSACGNDTSNNVSLTMNAAASITTQPTNQSGCAGSSESFTVAASGTGLTYQWMNGSTTLTNSGNISGATSTTLTINPTIAANSSSNYYVIVKSACGNDTSNKITLTVNSPATITTQPSNQTGCVGGSESFTVAATGTGITYQWMKGATALTNTGNVSGATSATLTFNPTTASNNGSDLYVIVYAACGNDTSSNALLTINSPATISTQPTNQAGCAGGSESFTVAATGTGITYQWMKGSTVLTNTGNISGATSATLTINPTVSANSGTYHVIVKASCGNDTSSDVTLTINSAAVITSQPSNQAGCAGSSESFTVAATGTGITYQWMKGSTTLTNSGNISGVTTSTLTINPTVVGNSASDYYVIVYASCGNDTSSQASLTVNSAAAITTQPSNQTGCAGGSESFTVAATGTGLTYQWMKGSTTLVNTANISGVTSATLTINPTNAGNSASDYYVIVYASCGNDTSAKASLTINSAAAITTQPTDQTGCVGGSESFVVIATGTNITYQWMKGSTILTNSGSISGVTTDTLTINPTIVSNAGSDYYVLISAACGNDTSANVSLTINSPAVITTQPTNQAACAGGSESFSVNATGSGLTYQWMKGSSILVNAGNISGATSATLTINPTVAANSSNDYYVIVYASCGNDTSAQVSLTINSAAVITTQPTNQVGCSGGSESFSVTATGTGITYQWMKGSTVLTNGANVSGVNTSTLTINPSNASNAGSDYYVIVYANCGNDTSNHVNLTINSEAVITTEPIDQAGCLGSSESFIVAATGTGLTYQWMKGSTILTNSGNISGVTSTVLTINPTRLSDTSTSYYVIVSGICGNDTSAMATLDIYTKPVITFLTANQTVCEGNSISFTVGATGTGLTYQWRKGTTNLTNGGNISGVNSSTLTINPATPADDASDYNVVITGLCAPTTTSSNVSLEVYTAPKITTAPMNQSGCEGGSESFWVIASGKGLTYQWRKGSTNLTNGGNISGVNTAYLVIDPISAADTSSFYNVIVSGACTPDDTSDNVSLMLCTENSIEALNAKMKDVVSIYPNPFTTTATIILKDPSKYGKALLNIYNVTGELVFTTFLNQQETSIDTDNLASGIYIYTIISESKTVQTGKIVSQK